jgi:hypothetical protein
MTYLTYDEWFDKYQPITNHITGYDEKHFETFGEEQDFVIAQPNENVWTEVDGDEGTYIISGFHYVNRIQYYVTENPWEEDVEVPTWVYRECDNAVEGECKLECPDCNGDGVIDIPCETREELEQIYGA